MANNFKPDAKGWRISDSGKVLANYTVRFPIDDLRALRDLANITRVEPGVWLRNVLAAIVEEFAIRGAITLPLSVVPKSLVAELDALKALEQASNLNCWVWMRMLISALLDTSVEKQLMPLAIVSRLEAEKAGLVIGNATGPSDIDGQSAAKHLVGFDEVDWRMLDRERNLVAYAVRYSVEDLKLLAMLSKASYIERGIWVRSGLAALIAEFRKNPEMGLPLAVVPASFMMDLESLSRVEKTSALSRWVWMRALISALVEALSENRNLALPLAVVSRSEAEETGLLPEKTSVAMVRG